MVEVVKTVEKAGVDFHYCELSNESLESIAALSDGADIIVVAGGDGTVNRILNATYHLGKPYVVLPYGSGNDFAKTFRCPKDGEGLLKAIEGMRTSTTDLWELNGTCVFVQSVFVGVSIKTVEIKEELKCNSYLRPIIKALMQYRPEHLRVYSDNATAEGDYLMVGLQNVRTACNGLKMTDCSRVDDGYIEVLLCLYGNRRRLILNLLSTKFSWVYKQPNSTVMRTKSVRIEGDYDMTYTVDGEIRRSKDIRVRLSDRKVTIVHL